jgi:phenylpyruvate tautomerase PptA (4-oxalocrotonate tautomerase family)
MPILEVTVVLKKGESLSTRLAPAIADAASDVFRSPAGRTWVRVSSVEPGMYAEDSGGPPPGVAPVFVSVLKAALGDREALAREARSLAEAIAPVVGRPPENVHVLYEAPASGRIAFGGRLMVD